MQQTEERLKSAENEKNYYKSRATEAMEDLDRGKLEMALTPITAITNF
jgi:predicted transcriptional regulator